jgi:hypothetical protein
MTSSGSANVLRPRASIHPLFDRSKFPPSIDYDGAFHDAALLATRLMDSPQGLQHDYAFCFGKNVPANLPNQYYRRPYANEPRQYACDKGVGELNATDVYCVQQQRLLLSWRVKFEVSDKIGGSSYACCEPQKAKDGARGCDSVIHINQRAYQAVLDKSQSPEEAIHSKFMLACTMLHEVAHVAHHHLFGDSCEDFRETSNVAEAGFEVESRIFGQVPRFDRRAKRTVWGIWQSREKISSRTRDEIARHSWQLSKSFQPWIIDPSFIKKLFDDRFWEGDYLRRGAVSLIPSYLAE